MKFIIASLLIAGALTIGLWGCQDVAPGPGGSSIGQVQGRVLDGQSRLPLINAGVLLTSTLVNDSVTTGSDGSYSFSIDLQRVSALTFGLTASKGGYRSKSLSLNVVAGATTDNDVYLDRDTITGVIHNGGTAIAHSIALVGRPDPNEISVFGVGGTEASILTWEVRDSLGFPIDIDHKDTVSFVIAGAPVFGGAYVSPSSAITNASGRIATTVNSGTVSGVIQFVATLRRDNDGVIVQSTPVLITVNGGLPDQVHFGIAPGQFNFAAYDWLARTNLISVQVGDKYSNPVKTGTAVYFNTTGGVISASGFTDPTSHAVVALYSGPPQPTDAVFGAGFAWIYANTLGQDNSFVRDSTLILFSGLARISNVNPISFAVPDTGSSPTISYTVSDENGNPLAPGATIRLTLQFTPPPNSQLNFVVTGDVAITMGDTQAKGPGTTIFGFRVVDQSGFAHAIVPVTVIIHVEGPNGIPPDWVINGTIG